VLAVAFSDHLLVVESPGFGLPDAIARIKTAAPGKPIRYVVPTHHHDDHSGGLRYLIAEGATVVTTPGNRGYFTRMAAVRTSLVPDDATLARPRLSIETITGGKRIFSDGARTVEIHDIGPSPHANEMVVAWLPNEGILFQGDLLNLPPTGEVFASSANDTTVHFAEWLARQGWPVRVLAGVHMAPGTKAQLDLAIAKRQ
jgi:glyoxylase-like metal-dependent hydrolase (beta-lactamase superfamily II)